MLPAACVFQSAPPRGGRLADLVKVGQQSRFNPRPRVGGDPQHTFIVLTKRPVSIRAPAWGATPIRERTPGYPDKFQSAPPRGGRLGRFAYRGNPT